MRAPGLAHRNTDVVAGTIGYQRNKLDNRYVRICDVPPAGHVTDLHRTAVGTVKIGAVYVLS